MTDGGQKRRTYMQKVYENGVYMGERLIEIDAEPRREWRPGPYIGLIMLILLSVLFLTLGYLLTGAIFGYWTLWFWISFLFIILCGIMTMVINSRSFGQVTGSILEEIFILYVIYIFVYGSIP